MESYLRKSRTIINILDIQSVLLYNIGMYELSKNKVAEFTNVTLKELNKLQKENIEMFDSLMVGASLLANGFEVGEVMFLSQYRFKPERKDVIDENNKLRSKVEELEDALLDVGAKAEKILNGA